MKKENKDAAKVGGVAAAAGIVGVVALHMVFWPAAAVTVPAVGVAAYIHHKKNKKNNGPKQ